MRAHLARDQRYICCYCTGTIARGNFHIEHFCPRDADERLTYIWSNLLASCQGGRGGLVDGRRHCGAAKDNWFEQDMMVSPLKAAVEGLFRFPLSGKVFPDKGLAQQRYAAVELTITNLHLNAPSLVGRRSEILAKAAQDVGSMSRAEWHNFYLGEHDGKLQEFWPALNYNYAKVWHSGFAP